MKITQLETIRLGEFPNIIWVRLHTDEGLMGLGETFMGAQAVEAYLHEWVAPKLVGQDPLAHYLPSRPSSSTGWPVQGRVGEEPLARPFGDHRRPLLVVHSGGSLPGFHQPA